MTALRQRMPEDCLPQILSPCRARGLLALMYFIASKIKPQKAPYLSASLNSCTRATAKTSSILTAARLPDRRRWHVLQANNWQERSRPLAGLGQLQK